MKKIIGSSMLCLVVHFAIVYQGLAQGITAPNTPSPSAKVSQTIGISTVTVSYSRPSVRGREVWGKLVPYGYTAQGFGNGNEAPWRAGANENTVIEFTHNATVEGKPVPAGSYGLFFAINADNTAEVILSKDCRSWGSFWYDQTHDLWRAPIKLREGPHTEMLTYDFMNLDRTSAELVLSWEKKQIPVSIKFTVDEIMMANIREELKGPIGFNWQGYASAAAYTLQNKVELEQGLIWIDQALATNKSYTTLNVKSGLLKETGKTAEAEKVKADALAIATEFELNNYGYQLMAIPDLDKAIEIFKLNTERFPRSANAWDSLGEGFALKGDSKNAISSFKKSLTLNPAANVKVNSEKFLKQLGAMK